MNIVIDDPDQAALLDEVATEAGISAYQYAQNIVTGWLEGRIRNDYAAKVAAMSTADLKTMIGEPSAVRMEIASGNKFSNIS